MGAFLHRHLSSDVAYERISPNRSEALVLGSDDECELEQRAAKRRRIEQIATQYLHGTSPLIISASLRGPLDKSWGNPWRKNAIFGSCNPSNRAKRLRDEIFRRRASDKAERKERRRMQEIEMSQRVVESHNDGLGKPTAQPGDHTTEIYSEISLERYRSRVYCSALKANANGNLNNRTSRHKGNLKGPIAQDGKSPPDQCIFPSIKNIEKGTSTKTRHPKQSDKHTGILTKSIVGAGGERMSNDQLTNPRSPKQKPTKEDSCLRSNFDTNLSPPGDTVMPSTILKPATLSKDDPQIRKARFTPINCQSSITGYDSLSGGKIAVLHSDDENQSNLVEAKRLSQRAVKEALAPAPQPEAEYVDMRIMEGYQSSKKLSRKATELALAAADQADNDLSPLRAEVHQSAERCGKTKPPKSKSSRAARKTKGDKVKGRGTEISKQKPLKQISQDRSNNSNEERFTRNIKHPHLTSPTPVSSLGFVYRKVGSNSAELDQPLAAVKPKTLQRRRPRPMMFESSPTSPRTPVFREFRRMDEHSTGLKKSKANSIVTDLAVVKNDKRFFKLNTTDNTTRCIGSDDLSQRSKIRPLEENKELVASTYDDAETFGEREAIVVEDNLAISSVASKTSTYQPCGQVSGPSIPDHQDPNAYSLSSRDLSTQAAMMMARRDFQEEFGSSIHEVDSLPDGFTNTPPAKANSTDVTAITPFHTFNTGSTNPVVNPNAHVEMPMSTQDLFNAASPFALSTAKKKWRRPSFTSLQAKTGEDFKVDGSGLKQHHSDKERRKARAVEDNDDGVEQLNTSQRGGQREDASSRPARSSTQSQLLASRSPLKERNIGTSFHNSSGSQPKPCRSQVATFSITPSGSLKEVSYQDGQRLLADIDLNAELDFAGSFLQSWDTESLIRK